MKLGIIILTLALLVCVNSIIDRTYFSYLGKKFLIKV